MALLRFLVKLLVTGVSVVLKGALADSLTVGGTTIGLMGIVQLCFASIVVELETVGSEVWINWLLTRF